MLTTLPRVLALSLAGASELLVAGLAVGPEAPVTPGLVISGVPSTAGTLYPGGNADVVLTVMNPNDVPVRIASLVARGAITSDNEALCPGEANLRFATPTAGVGSIEARATERIVLRGAVSMSPDAPQGCADRTFTIPLTFGDRSSP